MADRLVKVTLTADVDRYIASMRAAGAATGDLASRGDRASTSATALGRSQQQAASGSTALGRAAAQSAGSIDRQGKAIQTTQKLSDRSALSIGNLVVAAAAVGPALIPIGAAAIAAGIGLGGLGVAGILAFGGIKAEMEAGTATGKAFTAGVGTMKSDLGELQGIAATGVLKPFQEVVKDVHSRMPAFSQSVAGLSSSLGRTGASLTTGLLNVLQSLDPVMQTLGVHAADLAEKFERWTAGDGVARFAAFAQQNLPAVERMIAELVTAVGHLIVAFAPLGGQTLAAITAIASAINAIPLPVLTALVTAATAGGLAFKAWSGVAAIVTGVSAAMARVGASSTAASAGMARTGTAAAGAAAGLNATAAAATRAGASMAVVASGSTAASVALAGTGASMAVVASGSTAASVAMGRASLASRATAGSMAAMSAAVPVVAVAAVAAGIDGYIGKAAAADVSTGALVKSFDGLAKGTGNAEGALADVFRESGSMISVFGKQIGAQREEVVSMDDVTTRFASSADRAFGQGLSDKLGRLQNGKGLSEFKENVRGLDGALASMVNSGNADKAKAAFDNLMSGIKDPKIRSQVAGMFTAYNSSLEAMGHKADAVKPKLNQFGSEIISTGDAAADAKANFDLLVQGYQRLGSTQLAASGSASAFQAAIDGASASVKENGRTLNLSTEAGRANVAALDSIGSSTGQMAAAVLNSSRSQQQANAVVAAGRSAYIATAQSMGATALEAQNMANKLFGIPTAVSTNVSVPGIAGAFFAVDEFGRVVMRLQGRKVSIPADAPGARQTLEALAGISAKAIETSGKKVTITTTAPLAASVRAQIDGLASARVLANGKIVIDSSAPSAASDTAKIRSLTEAARLADGQAPNISTSTDAPQTRAEIESATRAAQTLDRQSARVPTDTDAPQTRAEIESATRAAQGLDAKSPFVNTSTNAGSAESAIRGALNAAQNKSHTITTFYQSVGTIGASQSSSHIARQDRMFNNANGAVYPGVRSFANGSENHVAQIARPGDWRLWAEPETGGEAYIPLAQSKRGRSMAILEDVARRFGMGLTAQAQGSVMSGFRASDFRPVPASAPRVHVAAADMSGLDGRMARVESAVIRMARVIDTVPDRVQSGIEGRTRQTNRSVDVQSRTGR